MPAARAASVARRRVGVRASTLLFWLLLLGLALALRLLQADARGIWQDEGLTLYQVRLPWRQIWENRIPVAQFNTQNTVPPLYFLALGAWGHMVGFSLWALRLFSIFCALLASVLLYRVGAWMDGPRAGRVAALLGALSPLYLWYAQELRMYTFLLVPATLSFGVLWRWYRQPKRGWLWGAAYALCAAAMAWTHYLAFPLIGAQVLWLLVVLLRRHPLLLLLVGAATALLAYPLVPFGMQRLQGGAERDFVFLPLRTIAWDLLRSFSFHLPVPLAQPTDGLTFLYVLAGGLLLLGLWQAWKRGGWPLATLLGAGLVLPVLGLYALSYIKPLYQNARHLIVVSPAFYLLWALGLNRLALWRRWLPLLLVPLFAWGWTLNVQQYFQGDAGILPLKNDVAALFRYIGERYIPGDVVALNDPVLQHALEYVAPGVPWVVLPPYGESVSDERAIPVYQNVAGQYERVWYVYGPPDSSFDTWRHVYDWFFAAYPRIGYNEFQGQTTVGVVQFDTQGPTLQTAPYPAAVPADARFPETIRYLGLFQPLEGVAAGRRTVIETLWAVEQQPKQDVEVVVRLADPSGRVWHQTQAVPFGGLHTTSRWLPGQWVRLPLFVEIPEALAPGAYTVELYLAAPDGRALFPEGTNTGVPLGQLQVEQSAEPGAVEGALVGDALRLAMEPLPASLPPFAALPLTLRVRVEGDGTFPDRWELEATNGETVWTEPLLLADGLPQAADGTPLFPPESWQPGDVVELRYEVHLPPELEGEWALTLSAYRGSARLPVERWWGLRNDEALSLGGLIVEPRARRAEPPPLDYAVSGEWPGTTRLLGYSVEPETASASQPIHFQLAWQALAPTEQPIKAFVQLLDEQGQYVQGADVFFDVPSTAWASSEIVLSEHRFEAGSVPPGRYTIVTGLYDAATLERLPIEAPNGALPLGTLVVAP